jgi:hypothetical protein
MTHRIAQHNLQRLPPPIRRRRMVQPHRQPKPPVALPESATDPTKINLHYVYQPLSFFLSILCYSVMLSPFAM